MSLNCKLPGFSGRKSANLRVKKAKEIPDGSDFVKKWRRRFLLLWILLVFTIGCVLILFRFGDGDFGRIEKCPDCWKRKAEFLLKHFNFSTDQLYAMAYLFPDSDQVLLCAEEIRKQQRLKAENVKPNDRCPVPDENIARELTQSMIEDKSVSYVPQSGELSLTPNQYCRKKIMSTRALVKHPEYCENSSFSLVTLVKGFGCFLLGVILSFKAPGFVSNFRRNRKLKHVQQQQQQEEEKQQVLETKELQHASSPSKGARKWRKKLLAIFVVLGVITSFWLFWHSNSKINLRREETLANMCEERARMLQDQFNVSMNHVHALAILVSTFHHQKHPSAIDQKTFGEYTESTSFERPLTSGVAYALKVLHSDRDQFERQHGWTIKKMETEDQTLVQDFKSENLDPAPPQDEYAPVIFSQETVSHIVSIDMMSGKEDRENILRARASGKGVLTSPFKLLKSNHVGVVLTFAVYNTILPLDVTPEQRIKATAGYLGASYDVPSLVEKLLHQLSSKQTIVVNVYDTTNASAPITMYGTAVNDTGLLHNSTLDFGDPSRKHEMHCRFKHKPPLPWTAINASVGILVITLLVGHIFHAAICRIAKVEADCRKMEELKSRAEAADVAKSQFLATVSHEIRTPMTGVLGMLQMLMDTDLEATQLDYAQTAHCSGKDLISLINEVLDQAKIESGRLELEAVPFDLRSVLDNVLSLFSSKSNDKRIELAAYVSNQVPEVVIGDPGRFRQIITNLVGNSIKFTQDKGHIFVSVHLVNEVNVPSDVRDEVLFHIAHDQSNKSYNTLSGFPVVDRWKSWEKFEKLNCDTDNVPGYIKLLVTVEDTGVGIPLDAQDRIFMPFMQADSSTSRTYGGTGIGLSISKRLVDLMGGEIGFVSEPGMGSTFSFTGAFRKGETASLGTKWEHFDSAISEFQELKALVIDKQGIRAEVTRYHLQRLKISVDVVFNLKSACSYLGSINHISASANLAMVLIDKEVWNDEAGVVFHQLVQENGENGSTEIPANRPKIFVLANSISITESNELKSAGIVDNVLMKPLRLSVLISCIQEALESGKKRKEEEKKPTLGKLLRGRRILVVDDNKVNRRVAEGSLKKYGAIVTCVESGKAALALLRPPHDFDACFMDLQMPEMDGFEATRQIRVVESLFNEKNSFREEQSETFGNVAQWHTPILAMTADVILATNEECVNCGMDGYVSKPFEEGQLYSAVACFFESG